MLDIIGGKQSQLGRYTDTIIGSQSSAVGTQPFAVDDRLDRIIVEIVFRTVIFLANHIHVRLQYDYRTILHSRSGRL